MGKTKIKTYLPQRRKDAKKRQGRKGLNLSAFAPWRGNGLAGKK